MTLYDCNNIAVGGFEMPFIVIQTLYRVINTEGLTVAVLRMALMEWSNMYLFPCTNGPQENGFNCEIDTSGEDRHGGAVFKLHKAVFSVSELWTITRLKDAHDPIYEEFWTQGAFIEQMVVRLSVDGTNWCVVGIVLMTIGLVIGGYALISCLAKAEDSCPVRFMSGICNGISGCIKCFFDSCTCCCNKEGRHKSFVSKQEKQAGWFSGVQDGDGSADTEAFLTYGATEGQGGEGNSVLAVGVSAADGQVVKSGTPRLANGEVDHNGAVAHFKDITGLDGRAGADWLGRNEWDVQKAADAFFKTKR